MSKGKPSLKVCPYCGNEYLLTRKNRLHTAEACLKAHAEVLGQHKREYRARERHAVTVQPRPCKYCGKPFQPVYNRVVVCAKSECQHLKKEATKALQRGYTRKHQIKGKTEYLPSTRAKKTHTCKRCGRKTINYFHCPRCLEVLTDNGGEWMLGTTPHVAYEDIYLNNGKYYG